MFDDSLRSGWMFCGGGDWFGADSWLRWMDGESHWMEGVMPVGVYAMLAVAFYILAA